MAYASRTDLEERYGDAEVAQRESMLPAGAIDRALADADAEIDSYLAGRYGVPLSPAPDQVVRVACQLARYWLLGDAAGEPARKGFEDARAWLRDVRAARADVDDATPRVGAEAAATVSLVTGRDKAFAGGL